MHIISRRKLREFCETEKDAEEARDNWYRTLKSLDPQNFTELRQTFPHADLVGLCTVFNVGGNKYRVITKVFYSDQVALVRFVLTHKEYDKQKWKADC